MFISPSVTPWRAYLAPGVVKEARNPALRVLRYDTDTLKLLDIEQYYMNLTTDNRAGKVTWLKEYSFTEKYEIPDVSTDSMANLLREFKVNETMRSTR